ncbi:MAG: ribosome small subunit-dependent GTPase A [Actinomycetota bacterium]|nr:ribosome small subunit-dependent GTPase A [Actinomycetota bacterium]
MPHVPDGMTLARVARVDRTAYDVLTDDGPARVPGLAPVGDPLLAPTVGDWLALQDGHPVGLLPRTSLLTRGAASGRSQAQPLAANVDVVLICAGLWGPPPVRRVERLLTLAWESGATPVVVLTKADLCADVEAACELMRLHAPGADVVAVAAAHGDVAALAPYTTPGTTLVLLGASGAGKSTVVNALAGAEVMSTGDVRRVDGKGRHTTTHRELWVLPSGATIIDTPGLRGVALTGDAEVGLAKAFADVEELAAACRFADCGHLGEPGCAVLASVQMGDLGQDRVDSWRHLQREMAFQARRNDARLRAAERAKWKAVSKAMRVRGYRP